MSRKLFSFSLLVALAQVSRTEQWIIEAEEYTMAEVNVTYRDPETRETYTESSEMAKFGTGKIGSASGILVHVRTGNGSSHNGCDPRYENEIPTVPWIALVRRGRCNFDDKLEAAYLNNASALIVYNNKEDGLQKMTIRNKHREQMVAVFISRAKGEELASLMDKLTRVHVQIDVGTHYSYRLTNINKTSVMFVSISFIVLMLISLAWLVYYYIQRFRQLHQKDKLSKQLTMAAKKAVAKIPTRSVKCSDKEVTDAECCPICIEPYKSGETVRVLPCRHQFHKACIDPWLLQHRTCPLCKMDILKHYGCSLGSQDSIVNVDMSSPIIGPAESTPRVRIVPRVETGPRLPVASTFSPSQQDTRQIVDVQLS